MITIMKCLLNLVQDNSYEGFSSFPLVGLIAPGVRISTSINKWVWHADNRHPLTQTDDRLFSLSLGPSLPSPQDV